MVRQDDGIMQTTEGFSEQGHIQVTSQKKNRMLPGVISMPQKHMLLAVLKIGVGHAPVSAFLRLRLRRYFIVQILYK
ncbi:hypothetical protein CWS43_14295 [Rahnella sp. AA]|nr:hypothetical protein CWS43_14295 [Rahnella sp. AA]